MSQFFLPTHSGELFAQALTSAYRSGVRLYDPSIALRQDPEAYESILLHGVIRQAFDRRTTLVAGLSWAVDPGGETPADKVAAKLDKALLENIRQFRESRKHLAGACVYGTAFAYTHWAPRWLNVGDGAWREWWVPTRLEAIDRRLFRGIPKRATETSADGRPVERIRVEWERHDSARGQWVVVAKDDKPNYIRHAFDDSPDRLGHGRGLIDAVRFLWYFRASLWEELLNGAEFWARGFLEVAVNNLREGSKINQTIVDQYVEAIERHRSRHVFAHDSQDEVKITQGGGEGANIVVQAISAIDAEIRTLINHANVNTSATAGGSYALADTQADSEQMGTILPDRESLSETLSIALVARGRDLNYANFCALGLAAARPGRFSITNQSLDDPEKTSRVFQTMLASGAPIPKRHYYERLGVPMPAEGEDVLVPTPAPAPASPFGFPPVPASDPKE